jgi:Ran GTPase-activating protein (RanGAP) involved in mRNA processing and transport
LGANQVQSQGAAAVASSLHSNKTVSKIYLEGNNIGLQGANAFLMVLEELDGNTTLKNLFVDNNNIGKEGSKQLASALNSAMAMGDGIGD